MHITFIIFKQDTSTITVTLLYQYPPSSGWESIIQSQDHEPQLREKTLAFPLHACTREEEFPGWLILVECDDMIPRCLTLAGALSSHRPPLLSSCAPAVPLPTQGCILLVSAHQVQISGFCPFSSALQLSPKTHLCPPSRKTLHPPVHLFLVHLLLSPPTQPFSS